MSQSSNNDELGTRACLKKMMKDLEKPNKMIQELRRIHEHSNEVWGRFTDASATVPLKRKRIFNRECEDGGTQLNVYKEKFTARSIEVGVNYTATVQSIVNFMQEAGCNHAQSVGLSTDGFITTRTMRMMHLIWVTRRMRIKMFKYPAKGDVVEIETWCQSTEDYGTGRNWLLRNYATGDVIGRASSGWCLRSTLSWMFQKIEDVIRDEFLVYCPTKHKLAFPEEDSDSQWIIPKIKEPAQCIWPNLLLMKADTDMHQRVNPATYIGWILEVVPQYITNTHELHIITLEYKQECQPGQYADSLMSLDLKEQEEEDDDEEEAEDEDEEYEGEEVPELQSTNSSPAATDKEVRCHLLHLLRLRGNNAIDINRGRTVWRKKPTT